MVTRLSAGTAKTDQYGAVAGANLPFWCRHLAGTCRQDNPTAMTAIRLITFDLDNTLWETDKLLRQAEQAVYDWLAQHCPEVTRAYTLEALFEARVAYWQQHPEFKHQISRMRRASLEHILRGCGYDRQRAQQKSAEAFEVFMDYRHRIDFFDHAFTVIETLGKNHRLGILSNGNACSRRLGIDRYFDFHYTAEQLGVGKPSPVPFRAALRHTGVEADECIHIGDSIEDDISGAAALGIHTIWFNPADRAWEETAFAPSAEVACLSEIPQAVTVIESRSTS